MDDHNTAYHWSLKSSVHEPRNDITCHAAVIPTVDYQSSWQQAHTTNTAAESLTDVCMYTVFQKTSTFLFSE